jgi:pimeloyl-ACP methyl ester carboxylesterase
MSASARLHVLHSSPPAAVSHEALPPLLFVHGGYMQAGCWAVNFMPWFAARGYACHALDLSGHGASPGRADLDLFGLDDYVADVAEVIASLPVPPVLIGHSMGAIVVQRCLEDETLAAAGLVLLAPVPPTGLLGASLRLNLSQPDFLREAARAVRGDYTEHTERVMRAVYFSPDAGAAEFADFAGLVQDESTRAIVELTTLPCGLPRRRRQLPALVIGGSHDALFSSGLLHFTASGWRAPVRVIPRAGHMLMLDLQWPDVAGCIADWLPACMS